MGSIYEQTKAAVAELCKKARLKAGNIVVVGCSTSEVVGAKIGTNSSPEVAQVLFDALHDYAKEKGIYLAIQCCEHLNRAIVVEKEAVPNAEIVNVVPQPKAGFFPQRPVLLRKTVKQRGLQELFHRITSEKQNRDRATVRSRGFIKTVFIFSADRGSR